MESEGSLPRSQAPATCPCTKPDQSIPHYSTSGRSILLSSYLRLRLTCGVFPLGLPPKPHTYNSCHPYVPYPMLKYICQIKKLYVWEKKMKSVIKYDLKRTRNLERLCATGWVDASCWTGDCKWALGYWVSG